MREETLRDVTLGEQHEMAGWIREKVAMRRLVENLDDTPRQGGEVFDHLTNQDKTSRLGSAVPD